VYQRLSSGRLKIFTTLQNTLTELRMYKRDEHGKVVKEFDHLMDCMRYMVLSGLERAATRRDDRDFVTGQYQPVDSVCGY
jgi:hypothetical protein